MDAKLVKMLIELNSTIDHLAFMAYNDDPCSPIDELNSMQEIIQDSLLPQWKELQNLMLDEKAVE